jgi:glutaredoxin
MRLRRIGMIVAAAVLATAAALAQPYKWTDKDGVVHYGDRPPRDAKLEEITGRITSYEGTAEVAPVASATNTAVSGVTLYGTTWCGYCKKARAWFAANGVNYRDLDVEADPASEKAYRALGGSGVPLIVVGKYKMQGWNPERMAALLQKSVTSPAPLPAVRPQ